MHRVLFRSMALIAFALLGVVGMAAAQQPRIDRIDVVEFGLYEAKKEEARSDPGTPSGRTSIISGVAFYEATTRVPARLGTGFGIRFVPVGAPEGAAAPIRVVWRLPAPGLRNPKSGNTYRESTSNTDVAIGVPRVRGYSLDEDWEIVTGDWTIELWNGERKLLSRTFTLYKP